MTARHVERRIERVYRVRFDEAGPDGNLRSSGFLRFAQDLAWIHSEAAGFGRAWYGERGLLWLVRGVELDIRDNVDHGTEVSVSTEVVGFRRVIARRRSEFRGAGNERQAAVAITDWVLLNDEGRPVRPPAPILVAFAGKSDEFTPVRVRHGQPDVVDAFEATFGVRRSEADPMAHVNNAGYVDYVDELYVTAFERPVEASLPVPRRYRAEFVGSAVPGARLTARSWQGDSGWCTRLTDEEGAEVLRATLEIGPATWGGG